MTNQEQTIERIVALVVQRLSAADAAQSPLTAPQSGGGPDGGGPDGGGVLVADAVITEHTLLAAAQSAESITVGPRSVLTPSAHDYLRSRNITWSRTQDGVSAPSGVSRLLIISSEPDPAGVDRTQVTDSLLMPWETRTLTTDSQAAQAAVEHATSARRNLVVVACGCAARVACLANRDARVRAAVVDATADAQRLSRTLSANVLCVESRAKTSFELRHLIRSILQLPVPSQTVDRNPDGQPAVEN
jgi:hypothetical protein